jgi:type II secretory pathway pseudopilin PulG
MRRPAEIKHRRVWGRGIIWTEVAVALPILALVTALALAGLVSYYRARSDAVARQAAGWAAAAQLQRYQAGAALDSVPPPGVLPPEITLSTTTQPAPAEWEGSQRVTVTAAYEIGVGRSVRERVSGYVRREAQP